MTIRHFGLTVLVTLGLLWVENSWSLPVITVATEQTPVTEEATGSFRAATSAVVAANVPGTILSVTGEVGQKIVVGQEIARIDERELRARLEQVRAANDQAQADLKRAETLVADRVLTQQEIDAARTKARATAAFVQENETLLRYAVITAPFSGVIAKKLVNPGDLATVGKPLFEIENPEILEFVTHISESLLDAVPLGSVHTIRTRLGEMLGTVTEISPITDVTTRTIPIKLRVDRPELVRSGQFGRIAIRIGERPALWVPESAVLVRGQLEFVFVIQDERTVMRIIKMGRRDKGRVEIVSGLSSGEIVVSEPRIDLREGESVGTIKRP